MAVPQIADSKPFGVLPVAISFQRWATELNIDYSTETIPIPPNEKDWQGWAERVIARNIFNNDQIPLPSGFPDWRSWAMRVVQCLNG